MARSHAFRTWDDYYIPGTSVLRNKFTTPSHPYGEPDPAKLKRLEEIATAARILELEDRINGAFDYDHMKAIHAHIFQDVYEWAGQERTAPVGQFMTKDGHAYYGAGSALSTAAEAEYAKLARKNLLRGLEKSAFVSELAESWGEVNVVHSFREGNTRAQFVFYSQLSHQAGYELVSQQFAPGAVLRDEFVQARFHSQDTGRNDRLAAVLHKAVRPAPPILSDQPPRATPAQIRATLRRVAAREEASEQQRHRAPEPGARGRDELGREL